MAGQQSEGMDKQEQKTDQSSQVIWLNWGLTDADLAVLPAGVSRGFMRSLIAAEPDGAPVRTGLGADLGDGKGRCLMAGEWNSAVYEPLATAAVRPEDVHCAKNRMSGMWTPSQPLWRELEARGLRTLFFTGVNTDQCVLGTLTDAYNAGWDSVLVEDCAATLTPGAREVCLRNISVSGHCFPLFPSFPLGLCLLGHGDMETVPLRNSGSAERGTLISLRFAPPGSHPIIGSSGGPRRDSTSGSFARSVPCCMNVRDMNHSQQNVNVLDDRVPMVL